MTNEPQSNEHPSNQAPDNSARNNDALASGVKAPDLLSFGPARLGAFVLVIFVGGFLVWSSLSPLSTAAVATGSVTSDGQSKIIQHLEGGIISEIIVSNGDKVQAGDPLVRLSDTQPAAKRNMLADRLLVLDATRDRILSEQLGEETIALSEGFPPAADRDQTIQIILESQQRLLTTRNDTYRGQKEILQARIEQSRQQITSLKAQLAAAREESRFIEQEIKDVQTLLDKGLADKPRLLALQRARASLRGKISEIDGQISQTLEAIGGINIQILDLNNQRMQDLSQEWEANQSQIAEVRERLNAAEDVLSRTVISSPVNGTVTSSRYFTRSGVIEPGSPIMEIVPNQERLVIEARLNPLDIDQVQPDLPAQVYLSAYTGRESTPLHGQVIHVAANVSVDSNTGQSYYLIRVEVETEELARYPHIKLYPGMPAEVMVQTGQRTLLGYLLEPLSQSLRRAFNET